MENRSFHFWLLVVAALAIATRTVFFLIEQPWSPAIEDAFILKDDAQEYHKLALSILEGHFSIEGKPNAIRTPGYPGFVAGIYLIFGTHPWVVLLSQILLDGITCFILGISLRSSNETGALLSSGLFAIDPVSIFYSGTLGSDTLFVFLLVSLFYVLNWPKRSQSYIIAGLLTGLLALTRPIGLYLPVIVIAWLIMRFRRKAVVPTLILLAVYVVTIAPWFVRNEAIFGHFAFSTSPSYNLLVINAARIESISRGADFRETQIALLERARTLAMAKRNSPADLNPFDLAEHEQNLAVRLVGANPYLFVKTYLFGIARMFANLNVSGIGSALRWETRKLRIEGSIDPIYHIREFLRQRGTKEIILGTVIASYMLCTYIGAVIGIGRFIKTRDQELWLCLIIALYFVFLTGAAGLARFKMPVIPFYLAYSGLGVASLLDHLIRSRKRSS